MTIGLTAPQAVDATLEVRLIDALGRVVNTAHWSLQLAAGSTKVAFPLVIRSPLCVHHRIMAR